MDYEERITAAELGEGEYRQELSLRPQNLQEYIGQKKATDNLKVFIDSKIYVISRYWLNIICYLSGFSDRIDKDRLRTLFALKIAFH